MIEQPACWSWSLPALIVDVDAEITRQVAEIEARNATLSPDARRTPGAVRYHLADPERYRFDQFHADRCALCGDVDDLVVDHDHRTGLVRGRLCNSCNLREGRGRGNVYAAYRERNPATICDYWAYYTGYRWTPLWWRNARLARALTGDPGWVLVERAAR